MNKKLNILSLILFLIGVSSIIYRLMIPEQISPEGIVNDNLGLIVVGIWTLLTSFILFIFNLTKTMLSHKNKTLA